MSNIMFPLVTLPDAPNPPLELLTRDATPEELIEASAANHIDWFAENAHLSGGEVRRENGLTLLYSRGDEPEAGGEVVIAFPRMDNATVGAQLDDALRMARECKVRTASCWSLLPTEPSDLGARLVARGFQWGWQPHWMALDLHNMPDADFPFPDGLHITLDDASDWEVEELPYYNRTSAARFQAHARRTPRRTYHFGAWLDGKLVGHSVIYISTGPLGVAGMYSVGVVPEAREKGVGRAVSLAACQYARALGCRYVLLNAATHIYERLGFVSLGYGQTWWMHQPVLASPPPSPELVAFVEAIGRGDTDALNTMATLPADLDASLLCRMTPLEVAARFQQHRAARWLLDRGASPDIIPLCDLGRRDRVSAALRACPDLANRQLGEWGLTPLHEAVIRGDVRLARLLLTANPDLTIRDTNFGGTPLSWAHHYGREKIIALLTEHSAAAAKTSA